MLSQVGESRLAAGDNHRFVVAKRLRYESKSNAASLLTLLLQHPAYRDRFPAADSGQHDNVSEIRLEDFVPIDAQSARQAIETFWADERFGLPNPGATEQFKELIREVDLDHAKTLRREGFREFVIINPDLHLVTLLVLGMPASDPSEVL